MGGRMRTSFSEFSARSHLKQILYIFVLNVLHSKLILIPNTIYILFGIRINFKCNTFNAKNTKTPHIHTKSHLRNRGRTVPHV